MFIRQRATMFLFLIIAFAATVRYASAEVVYPNGIDGNFLTVSITQSNGQVSGIASGKVKHNCTARVSISIQKYVNNQWVSVACSNGELNANATCTKIAGYQYRVRGILTVYDASGKEADRITKYSRILN